jgi:hypothetical protein
MPALSAAFLVIALWLAVVFGPQTRPWSWGPALIPLAASLITALPLLRRKDRIQTDAALIFLGILTTAWFAARAWMSPVREDATTELLLLTSAVGIFTVVRCIADDRRARNALIWGITLLLLASVIVCAIQVADPSYSPVFRARADDKMISGFFAHYIDGSNFLVACSMIVGATAMLGAHAFATRCFFGIVALGGFAATWFTLSRGGILAGIVATIVLIIGFVIVGRKEGRRWFAPLIIALPLIGIAAGSYLLHGWAMRSDGTAQGIGTVAATMDNTCRLHYLGIAFSCIFSHPLMGGGAGSFSWECFRFMDPKILGNMIGNRPEMVHNEFLQAATDYGLIGAGLLTLLITGMFIAGFTRMFTDRSEDGIGSTDAWRVGGAAALAGMLTQSMFSFVFHLLPGALMLGLAMGLISRVPAAVRGRKSPVSNALLALAGAATITMLLPRAWDGTRILWLLWPTHFSKHPELSEKARIQALDEAIRIWPQSSFHAEHAALRQSLAGSDPKVPPATAFSLAIDDLGQASALDPFEPSHVVQRAYLLSHIGRDAEAESEFQRAIELQGGMEAGFRARFQLARHHLAKGRRALDRGNARQSLPILEEAVRLMEYACELSGWVRLDMQAMRAETHETLGIAREITGDRNGALERYNYAANVIRSKSAHYRAASAIARIARDEWSAMRLPEALARFIEAKSRVDRAEGTLPPGITPAQRDTFVAGIDWSIRMLRDAGVQPAK